MEKWYEYIPVMITKVFRREDDVDSVTQSVPLNESDPWMMTRSRFSIPLTNMVSFPCHNDLQSSVFFTKKVTIWIPRTGIQFLFCALTTRSLQKFSQIILLKLFHLWWHPIEFVVCLDDLQQNMFELSNTLTSCCLYQSRWSFYFSE